MPTVGPTFDLPAGAPGVEQPLADLSFARLTAFFEVSEPVSLPTPFTGSTFHGLLGYCLPQVRPQNNRPACRECSCRAECRSGLLAPFFFQAPAEHPYLQAGQAALPPRYRRETYPPPLILEPPTGGDYERLALIPLTFVLVGQAIRFLPFIACALRQFACRPVGRGRGRLHLYAIVDAIASSTDTMVMVYSGVDDRLSGGVSVLNLPRLAAPGQEQPSGDGTASCWGVRFLTPFSYRKDDRFGQPLTFPILLRNLLRRLTLLTVYSPLTAPIDFSSLLAAADAVTQADAGGLTWQRLSRYSRKDAGKMHYGGWLGEITFAGARQPFWPYLQLGEFLHVGKMASFGLGQYQLICP